MNPTPHTHQVQLRERNRTTGEAWMIRYGDTLVFLAPVEIDIYECDEEDLRAWVKSATERAIRLHDEGTKTAYQRQQEELMRWQRVQQILREADPEQGAYWASEGRLQVELKVDPVPKPRPVIELQPAHNIWRTVGEVLGAKPTR